MSEDGSGTVPVAASTVVAPVLDGPVRPVAVIARARTVAYLEVGDPLGVVALVAPGAVATPSALLLPDDVRAGAVLDRIGTVGGAAAVGAGAVHVGDAVRLRPVRWWDPRPRLAPVDPAALAARRDALAATVERTAPEPDPVLDLGRALDELVALLVGHDHEAARAAVRRLVGRGRGFTPAGDDALAGLVAAITLVRRTDRTVPGASDRLGDPVADLVPTAARTTTAVAATTLRLAARGAVAPVLVPLLRALTAPPEVSPDAAVAAAVALVEVGHSSGHDTARGVLAGIDLVLAGGRASSVGAAGRRSERPVGGPA